MHHSKKTNAGQVGLEKHLQTSLSGIERKAKYKKDHKFENLYKLLNKWNLGQSWQYINKRAADRFMIALEKRFGKFGLELAKDKTKLIKFSRFSKDINGDFDFLGFTFRWSTSRKGKDLITHTTSKKKFNASAKKIK